MTFMKIFSYLTIFVTTVLSDCISSIKTDVQFVISASNRDFNHCPENRICSTSQLVIQISPLVNQIGIVQFDKTANVIIPLNSHIDQLNEYINNQIPISSSMLTDKLGNGLLSTGLVQAMQQYKLYSQSDSQKLLVIIVDNYDMTDIDSIKFVINVLKSQFVICYGILIGNNTRLHFLKQLMMTKMVNNWSDVSDLNVSINKELANMICNQYDYCTNSQLCNGHGICVNQVGSYICQCDIGYIDYNCQTYNFCINQNLCQNGGQCVNTNKGFQCSCISGYYGSVCQYRESCYVNPCQNSGTCVDQIDGFKCICSNSYTGLLCDQRKTCNLPIIEHAYPLSNCVGKIVCNVQCLPDYIPTQSVIICINGNWTLSNCEYNPCVTNRCNGHGNCQTNGLTYHCQCESCYTGVDCQDLIGCLLPINVVTFGSTSNCTNTSSVSFETGSHCLVNCNNGYYTNYTLTTCNCGKWDNIECKPVINGNWSDWSDCTDWCNNVTCDINRTCTRYRSCNNPMPSNGGQLCIGDSEQEISCPIKSCPKLEMNITWGNWVMISNNSNQLLCDSNIECTYHRDCFTGNCSNNQYDYRLTQICGRTPPCPIDCQWDQWTLISQITPLTLLKCSQYPLCLYKRSQSIPLYGGLTCHGSDTMISNCTNYKPVDCVTEGVWTEWQLVNSDSNYCDCRTIPCNSVKTCTWYRNCTSSNCVGDSIKSINCTILECPVNGGWSNWSKCDCLGVLCGTNVYCNKTRYCNNPPPSNGGKLCQSNNYSGLVETITEKCNNTRLCSTSDCHWTDWSMWSKCNDSCEVQQTQTRTRSLLFDELFEYTQFCQNQSSIVQFRSCPVDKCNYCLCSSNQVTTNSICSGNDNQIKCECKYQLDKSHSNPYKVVLNVDDPCNSLTVLTSVGGIVKTDNILVNSVTTNEKSKCCIRHNAFVVSENGCISKRNGELTQFKPCNYGTSVCVINHRSDFDQITWTNNGYNCQNKQITYHIQSLNNVVTIIYQYIGINYTDIIEHIHRLELVTHGILPEGANPFAIGSILQIQNNGSSSTMILSTDNHYQNTGLIIGLTLGLSGLCVILFISVLIFIMIVTKKKQIVNTQLAYCTTPKHSSDTELSNVAEHII